MSTIKIVDASYHRNGTGGEGFWAVLFDEKDYGRMIASLFDKTGFCAVYKIDELSEDNIRFGCGNSWRGDHYEEMLRPALAEWRTKEGKP